MRIRRWQLTWHRWDGSRHAGHRFWTRRAALRSQSRLSGMMGLPCRGLPSRAVFPTTPVDVQVERSWPKWRRS